MTAPKEPSGSASGVEAAQVVEHGPATVPPPSAVRVLDLRALLVGGQREHEDAGVVAAGGVEHRVERAEAEERAGRDRVGGQRRGRVEVGVGVRLAGGADVAALHVEQHQRAGGAGVGDHPLEHGDPAAAEALVERRLRLDHRRRAARPPRRRSARTARARRRRRSAPSRRAAPACGSMPTQNGPRSAIAACRRAPKVSSTVSSGRGRAASPRGGGGVVEQRGADLDGGRAGVEEAASVGGGGDAAATDDRDVGQGGVHLGRRSAARSGGSRDRRGRPVGRRAARRAGRRRRRRPRRRHR